MNITRYNKAIVAVVWAIILIWNTLRPESAVDASESDVREWVTTASAVLGPLLVWAVPNKLESGG